MIAADFHRLAADALGPRLRATGWQSLQKSAWSRPDVEGESQIALDPSRQFDRFAVLLSWDPADVAALVRSLLGEEYSRETVGFLCGPYLTPGGVFRRPKQWRSRTKADFLESLDDVHARLLTIGEPWLSSLRDPLVLAKAADPVAALMAGYAWERAGRPDQARPLYEEMWRRLEDAFNVKSRSPVPGSMKRQYLFLADRLGRTTALVERLRCELGRTEDHLVEPSQ